MAKYTMRQVPQGLGKHPSQHPRLISEGRLSTEDLSERMAEGCTFSRAEIEGVLQLLGEELIRKVGSEGQNKTFLIALKFAQYVLLSATNPERPLLLLDDIFDKLDAERVERIIRLVGGSDFGQIFITDTNRKHLDEIVTSWGEDYRLFEVSSGEVRSIDSTPTHEAE